VTQVFRRAGLNTARAGLNAARVNNIVYQDKPVSTPCWGVGRSERSRDLSWHSEDALL